MINEHTKYASVVDNSITSLRLQTASSDNIPPASRRWGSPRPGTTVVYKDAPHTVFSLSINDLLCAALRIQTDTVLLFRRIWEIAGR
eukprot:4082492-Amphidinium_carterae.1